MCDYLFLMWNCPECAEIKQAMKEDAIFSDDFKMSDGRSLHVFYTFSNPACRTLLDTFGLQGKFTPVLKTQEGLVMEEVSDIVGYFSQKGVLA